MQLIKYSGATLVLASLAAADSASVTSSAYSIPINLSVISSVLVTATDSRMRALVSEFQAAKGTSALISLASEYGSLFTGGSLTDITSLAAQVATVSGANDAGNVIATASSTVQILRNSTASLKGAASGTVVSSGAVAQDTGIAAQSATGRVSGSLMTFSSASAAAATGTVQSTGGANKELYSMGIGGIFAGAVLAIM